jgi:hypothetical protein
MSDFLWDCRWQGSYKHMLHVTILSSESHQ